MGLNRKLAINTVIGIIALASIFGIVPTNAYAKESKISQALYSYQGEQWVPINDVLTSIDVEYKWVEGQDAMEIDNTKEKIQVV